MAAPTSGVLITPKQVELIKSTWELVKPIMQEAGLIMFYKLFEIDPKLQDLFSFKGEELNDQNEGLRKHALQVMETVNTAVNSLGNIPALKEVLVDLGVAHSFSNVKSKHFAPVGLALVHALAIGLKEAFTDEAKEAWLALYGFVQTNMIEGMDEEEED